jgi:hypothetical protein
VACIELTLIKTGLQVSYTMVLVDERETPRLWWWWSYVDMMFKKGAVAA